MIIEPCYFNLFRYPQAKHALDAPKNDARKNHTVQSDTDHADQLTQKLRARSQVSKQTDRQCAPDSTHEMNRNCAYGIIDFQFGVQIDNRNNYYKTGDKTDQCRVHEPKLIGAGRDPHQACQGPIQQHGQVQMLDQQNRSKHCADDTSCSAQ